MLQFLECLEQEQDDEGRHPSLAERAPERDLFLADAGEHVGGEEDLFVGRGLLRFALGFGVEHRDCELRRFRRRGRGRRLGADRRVGHSADLLLGDESLE